jgi:alpha-L-fucosidase
MKQTFLITLLMAARFCAADTLMLPDQTETPRLKRWIDYHYGMFIHFNINTSVGTEHVPNPPPATTYAPTALNVDSWVRLAKDAGMKYAVLTTKHDGGFCLWDSKAPWRGKEFAYDVAASGNKTDVVKAFVNACKKYGIAPGFYYCLADCYANKSATIPDIYRKGVMPDDAFELAKAQLAELATNYPECHYFWLDTPKTASVAQQAALYDLLRRKNPEIVVLMNHHLAGPKKMGGTGAETGDQTLVEKGKQVAYPVDVLNTEVWQKPKGVVSRIQQWQGKPLFMGYEHCDVAGGRWFNTMKPKSAAALFQLYKTIRQAGGNLLLNVGPTPAGTMRPEFRTLLLRLKPQIEAFEKSLAARQSGSFSYPPPVIRK